MSEPGKTYPAGMSAERFKELTTPFTLKRFGRVFPIPALYTPEVLMKMLLEKEAKGEVFEKPRNVLPEMFQDEGSWICVHCGHYKAFYDNPPIIPEGASVCSNCGYPKKSDNNPVAPSEVGK